MKINNARENYFCEKSYNREPTTTKKCIFLCGFSLQWCSQEKVPRRQKNECDAIRKLGTIKGISQSVLSSAQTSSRKEVI